MKEKIATVSLRDFQTADLDWVIDRHAELYQKEQGFDRTFRAYVEEPLRSFAKTADPRAENLWIGEVSGRPAGMIAIVRQDEKTAQLRWYLVEPELRGRGVGKALLETALNFCRTSGYRLVFLWTVSQLAAARHLYQSFGFVPTDKKEHYIWGQKQTEERWQLTL